MPVLNVQAFFILRHTEVQFDNILLKHILLFSGDSPFQTLISHNGQPRVIPKLRTLAFYRRDHFKEANEGQDLK